MRFVTFEGAGGKATTGVLVGELIADLSHPTCSAAVGGSAPSLLEMVRQGLPRWTDRLASVRFDPAALRPRAGTRLLAPLRPGKIVGAAFNFTDGLERTKLLHVPLPVDTIQKLALVYGPGAAVITGISVTILTFYRRGKRDHEEVRAALLARRDKTA